MNVSKVSVGFIYSRVVDIKKKTSKLSDRRTPCLLKCAAFKNVLNRVKYHVSFNKDLNDQMVTCFSTIDLWVGSGFHNPNPFGCLLRVRREGLRLGLHNPNPLGGLS
jgi:hypothetical protein